MESSGLLRKAWEKYVMEEFMRPSPFPSESCSNYKPRETEVITDISNDIKLHKVKCIYTDDKSVAWEEWQDDDGNEWVKREDVEDY
jgi:hypothetical protein